MAPLRINKTFSPLGTPDHVQIYTEKLACHALSNWIAGEAVKKILAPSAAPSALIAEAPNSRPHGRAYSLAALRASAPIWETPGTASSGLCAHMGNSRYCLFGPLRPYRETPDTASPNLQVNVGTPARVPNGTHL
jgi:hypothetical protein